MKALKRMVLAAGDRADDPPSKVNTVKQALSALHSAFNELSLIMLTYSDGSTNLDPIPWGNIESVPVAYTKKEQGDRGPGEAGQESGLK